MNCHHKDATPGYEWHEMGIHNLESVTQKPTQIKTVNLKNLFPLPDKKTLQETWDMRESNSIETKNGTKIHTLTFNPRAMGGTVFWLPGWGVTNRWNGGARVATSLAALNPNKVIRTAGEISFVPREQKIDAIHGDMKNYAENYMYAIDDRLDDLDTLSGHSRGGVIQANLAARSDMPTLSTINLIDVPRARSYRTAAEFVFRIGILDNIANFAQLRSSDAAEEIILREAIPEKELRNAPDWAVSYNRAQRQWWLLRSLAKAGLQRTIKLAFDNQQKAEFFCWHGDRNIGVPIESTRKMIHELYQGASEQEAQRLHYFESPTGHYSVGHTARYGRQTAFALSQNNMYNPKDLDKLS